MLPNRWAKRLKTQESVQRSLCRIGFLLFAMGPTLFILGSWLWSIMPWTQYWTIRSWEHSISLSIGADVDIRSVQNFAPHQYRLHDVALKHPETGKAIARIPAIEFQRGPSSWHLRLQSPSVELEQALILVQAIHRRFLCQPNLAFPTTTCSLRGLTLMSDSPAMEPIYLESRFQCDEDKTSLQARFDLATNDGSQSACFTVERLHQAIAPRTSWSLETQGLEIPSKVLAAFQPNASQLGPDASFCGDMRWEQDEQNWRAEIAGIFRKVRWNDPQSPDVFPETKATHNVRVEHIDIQNGHWMQVNGLVTAESGSTSDLSRWLAAAMAPAVQSASHVSDAIESTAQLRNAPSAIQR
jgi:hypothetical protein